MHVISNIDLVAYLVCSGRAYKEARLAHRRSGVKDIEFLFFSDVDVDATAWEREPDEREDYTNFKQVKAEIERYVAAIIGDKKMKEPNITKGQTLKAPTMENYFEESPTPS